MFGLKTTGLVALGSGIAILLLLAWALRLDDLRSGWKSRYEGLSTVVVEMAGPEAMVKGDPAQTVRNLAKQRDIARRERDAAKNIMIQQGESIRLYKEESDRLRKLSTEQRAEIVRLSQQREVWIAKAEAASTRTERLAAEAEVKICEQVMDELYANGF